MDDGDIKMRIMQLLKQSKTAKMFWSKLWAEHPDQDRDYLRRLVGEVAGNIS